MQENQRVRLTKTLLKNSLTELAETRPLEKISVKSLCSRAGINRSTFYTHYGSPYDVLHDMEEDFIRDFSSILGAAAKKKSPLPIQEQIRLLCGYLQKNADKARLIFRYNSPSSGFVQKLFQIRAEETHIDLSRCSESEAAMLKVFFSSGIYSMISSWLEGDFTAEPEEIGEMGEYISARIFSGDQKHTG